MYPGLEEFDGTDGSPSRGEGTELRWVMGTVGPCRLWVPGPWGTQDQDWDTPLSDRHVSSATQVHMACSPQEWWPFGGVCISAGSYLWLEARAGYESRAGVSPAPFWKITPFFLAVTRICFLLHAVLFYHVCLGIRKHLLQCAKPLCTCGTWTYWLYWQHFTLPCLPPGRCYLWTLFPSPLHMHPLE